MKWRNASVLDLYNLSFGIFLFVSPWLFAYASESARVDIWVSSVLIVAISIAATVAFANWEEFCNLALGIWLMVSPWVLGFAHTRPMHLSIALGAVVAFVAALELWLVNYEPEYQLSRRV